jgi:hypothetical protein
MTPDYRLSLIRSFERHLRAENRSEHTIASYLDSLRQAEAFLAGRGRSLLDARREDLEAFLGELLQRRAPETVATRYRRLRVLYRWLEEEEEIPSQPHGAHEATDRARPARPGRPRGRPPAAAGRLRGQGLRGPPRACPALRPQDRRGAGAATCASARGTRTPISPGSGLASEAG